MKAGLDCEGYSRLKSTQHDRVLVATKPSTNEVTLRPSLIRLVFESRHLSTFWDTYLPTDQLFSRHLPEYLIIAGWIPAIQQNNHHDSALHNALLALSVASLGRAENQKWMCQDSLRFYIKALRDMNVGLKHPTRRTSDALLLASKSLGIYEVSVALIWVDKGYGSLRFT